MSGYPFEDEEEENIYHKAVSNIYEMYSFNDIEDEESMDFDWDALEDEEC